MASHTNMSKKEKYILMYEENEVLSFIVTFNDLTEIEIVDKLAHFDKAPFGIKENNTNEENSRVLHGFFASRKIPQPRWDYNLIIKNIGVENSFHLIFKGHGLSLNNHYWFRKEDENLKYKDINFFTNKWDDSFARAVLSGRYKDLKNVDLNVPDILTPGWGVKGWIIEDDGPKLYKLGIAKDHYEEAVAEVLSSRLAQRLFNKGEAVEYELKQIYGKYASVSKPILTVDEELVHLSDVLSNEVDDLYRKRFLDHNVTREFFKDLDKYDVPGLKDFFTKISCFNSLCFVTDLHFNNLSAIKNNKTGEIRLAPLFDFGHSFGSSTSARNFLSTINSGTFALIYFLYGDLDPDWDYSWYHPESLIGFEDEIRELLPKSEFYTPELVNNIINVYQHQKEELDKMARKYAKEKEAN